MLLNNNLRRKKKSHPIHLKENQHKQKADVTWKVQTGSLLKGRQQGANCDEAHLQHRIYTTVVLPSLLDKNTAYMSFNVIPYVTYC